MVGAFITSLLLLAPGQLAESTPTAAVAPDTAVICPAAFRPALQPWLDWRTSQGRRIALVDADTSADVVRTRIRAVAAQGKLTHVLLVGDALPRGASSAEARALCVPAPQVEAKVNVKFGSERTIASDNWYADLDDDGLPDVAIGRLTPDTPAELTEMVKKIIAYERTADWTAWRRQINFVAGLGGFGALADRAIEAAARTVLTEGIPASYVTTMTYASWTSPYCPNPRAFGEVAVDRMNEGCLFWVYIGHGRVEGLDAMEAPDGWHKILEREDLPRLKAVHGAPIALFLSCYTAAFDAKRDCLAEELLRAPGGPVAIVGGSRITMPYSMSVLGREMIKQCFCERTATIGEVLMRAKRESVTAARTDDTSQAIDAIALAMYPAGTDLKAERAELVQLFNLLGDPLLRINHPAEVEVKVDQSVTAGNSLHVEGVAPWAGSIRLELAVRRDRLAFQPPSRQRFELTIPALDEFAQTYRSANDGVLVTADAPTRDGRFDAQLLVPASAWGECNVRAYMRGPEGFATGSAPVQIDSHAAKPAR